jgi:hypothetical protein
MNFTKFITSSVLRFLYWLVVILETIAAVGGILSSFFTGSVPYIVLAIIFFPLIWLVEIIFARVIIEIIMILFRMHDDLAAIRMQGGSVAGGASAGGAAGGQAGYQNYGQQDYGPPPPDYPTQPV